MMSLQAAILGFVALEPSSGYTLKQRFDGSVGSFWSATQSQIYRELHRLEADGLVTVERTPGDGKPDRKIYALTARGREALGQWLVEAPEPLLLRHPLLLKFVFAADLPPRDLDGLLARYADGVATTRAEYAQRLESPHIFALARSAREQRMWRLAVEHGLAWCDMELQWLGKARRELTAQRKETPRWNRKAKSSS
jgi:PadR family transcriptional regulator, regulatory protein AphA